MTEKEKRINIAHNKAKEILQELGISENNEIYIASKYNIEYTIYQQIKVLGLN